jgi:outer membrane protein OmpA-like peptidoglycan-associated protein
MKKLMMLLAVAGFSTAVMAQEETTPEMKNGFVMNSFWSNWFVEANASYSAFYSNEEKPADYSKSPLKHGRRSYGLSVAIGKRFTPVLGLRTKLSGFWGKSVLGYEGDEHVGRLTPGQYVGLDYCNAVTYFNLQEQFMVNLSNLFCGYNESRVWNVTPYAGAGVVRNCSYNTWNLGISAGIQNTWRLSDRFKLNLDLNYNITGDDFEGEDSKTWGGHQNANHDHWFTAEIGLTYNISKKYDWDRVPDVEAIKQLNQSQLDALNAQLADANAEIERLRNQPIPEPKETVVTQSVKDFITTPISVFFNLNKTEIAVLKDLVNVKALAKFAIENDRNILVTGYADSATGTPEHNMWLSDKRAERVKNELINMGVKPEKISTAHFGGVEILTPVDFNRRATVQITED